MYVLILAGAHPMPAHCAGLIGTSLDAPVVEVHTSSVRDEGGAQLEKLDAVSLQSTVTMRPVNQDIGLSLDEYIYLHMMEARPIIPLVGGSRLVNACCTGDHPVWPTRRFAARSHSKSPEKDPLLGMHGAAESGGGTGN
jgi:hypothetical protein